MKVKVRLTEERRGRRMITPHVGVPYFHPVGSVVEVSREEASRLVKDGRAVPVTPEEARESPNGTPRAEKRGRRKS